MITVIVNIITFGKNIDILCQEAEIKAVLPRPPFLLLV